MGFNRLGRKDFAPETAVGTGAAEPLVDEYEAAKAAESVDESTAGKGKNQPGNEGVTIDYSGEDSADVASKDGKSTGEDYEVRNADNDDVPLAGASVPEDDSEVNKPAEETRPKAPQKARRN